MPIICDEGYGDMIQFARFIPKAAELCGEVVLGWDPVIPPLFGGMPCVASAHAIHATIPPFDAGVLLGDLPGVFGVTLDSIPAEVPYLPVHPEACQRWGARLNAEIPAGQFRVGLFWSGRPTHLQNHRRSLRLAQLAPVLDIPGVQFAGIQIPVPEQDQAEIAARSNVLDLSASLTSFAETAAIIQHLDLVISVDSAVAHLAGALGKPVWTMIYKPPDWRWLIDRTDSPWYPTMRLFHQSAMGDWTPSSCASRMNYEVWSEAETGDPWWIARVGRLLEFRVCNLVYRQTGIRTVIGVAVDCQRIANLTQSEEGIGSPAQSVRTLGTADAITVIGRSDAIFFQPC